MKYFIIAGEASGDIHAAGLIDALRKADSHASFRFFGGDLMARAAGCKPVIHYSSMAYMGFTQVIKHLPDVKRNLECARGEIGSWRPDAVILIDYPSFNLRIAAFAHDLGIPVFYYIPPKVWAWKEHRVKALKHYVDRIFSILPFESEFYAKHGMEVEYVGNPTVIEVDRALRENPARPSTHDKPLIALVPGSRVSEIRNNLPVMLDVAAAHADGFDAVIAGAPSLPLSLYREYTALPVETGCTFELMRSARAALVTSGTATLECALVGTPQVACYRGNGSRLTYSIMSRWLKIPFVTLPNLIAGREVIPELLMHHCNAVEVDRALSPLLREDSEQRTLQIQGYEEIRRRLGTSDPATASAAAITEILAK